LDGAHHKRNPDGPPIKTFGGDGFSESFVLQLKVIFKEPVQG